MTLARCIPGPIPGTAPAACPYDAGVSDLQCPATLLVLGREGWPGHLPIPEDRNVAVVYCPADDIEAGADLADRLDAALRPVHDLTAPAADDPPSVDEGTDWTILHEALRSIADLHRGETVVVITPTGEAGRELRIDADGWAVSALSPPTRSD